MSRPFAAVAVVLTCGVFAPGQAPPAGATAPAQKAVKTDPTAELIHKLNTEKVKLGDTFADLTTVPLIEILQTLSKVYDIRFVIAEGGDPTIREKKLTIASTKLDGMSLRVYLETILNNLRLVPILRKDHIEVMPAETAARETGAALDATESRLAPPLVSAVVKEMPLNEAVSAIAEEYGLTVVVSPQTGDNRTGFVSARLLNVPADRALELLAVQADLRVVKRGNAFLVTSRDHANALADERTEDERRKAEVKQLRKNGPPPQPPAPEPPAKPGM